jgi:PilZ domain
MYMQKFEYRSPRIAVDLPVQLTVEQSTLSGRCRNISKEGMRLEFRHPLPPDAQGTVILSCHANPLQLSVRVAYSGKSHGGVEFVYNSDVERDAVARLIASLAASANRPRLALLH